MKNRASKVRWFATLCAVCIILSGLPSAMAQTPSFVQIFGGSGRDTVYDALVLSDGKLLLCCNTQEGRDGRAPLPTSDCLAWLLCLNPDGSVAWEQVFGPAGKACVTCRPLELENGTIAVKFHTSQNQVGFDVYNKYFTLDGEPLGEDDMGHDWPSLYPVEDGYLELQVDNQGTGDRFGFVTVKGETLWSVARDQVTEPNTALKTLEGYLMVGRTPWDKGDYAAVTLLAKGGKVLWESQLTEYENSAFGGGEVTSDGGLVAAGGSRQESDGRWRQTGLVAKWNQQGKLQWIFAMPMEDGSTSFGDVAQVSGNYVAIYRSKTDTRIGFVLLDSQGKEIGRAETDRKGENYRSMELLQGAGGVWMFGAVEWDGQDDFLVMKLDVPGMFH